MKSIAALVSAYHAIKVARMTGEEVMPRLFTDNLHYFESKSSSPQLISHPSLLFSLSASCLFEARDGTGSGVGSTSFCRSIRRKRKSVILGRGGNG